MGIPGSLYSRDFGDPVFCLRKFTTCPTLAVQVQFSKHAKCKMSESGKIRHRGDCMRSKYCDNGGSRDKSWATTWGESHRHQQMNPIYVSTINSTPRNIKELRWREVLQQGFFLVRLWFLLQSYRSFIVLLILISANLWKSKLADIKMSNFVPLSQRCTHILTL